MANALITGGCGFVGRHLTARLLSNGYHVWILDNLSTGVHPDHWLTAVNKREQLSFGTRFWLPESTVTFIEDDALAVFLRQLAIVPGARVPFPEFDLVFALASVVGGRKKIDGDPMEVAIDLGIDSAFFLWAVRNKAYIGNILYASSSAAYPVDLQTADNHVALQEPMLDLAKGRIGQPDMTYGWSKLTGEYLSFIAHRHYGLKIACVRPFSGYGEDQDLTYPVPAIALRAARRENPLIVWGTGEQGRDFVHIEDCITAMLLAVRRIHDGSAVNIGTGKLTTFKQAARLFAKLAAYEPEIRPLINQPVGVQSRYCDPEYMAAQLGWKPAISLEDGFGRVLNAAYQRIPAVRPAVA